MEEERLARAGNLELILPNGSVDSNIKFRASSYDNGSYVNDKALFSFGLLLERVYSDKENLRKSDVKEWVKGFSKRFGFEFPGYIENAGNYTKIDLIKKEITIGKNPGRRNTLMIKADDILKNYGFTFSKQNP